MTDSTRFYAATSRKTGRVFGVGTSEEAALADAAPYTAREMVVMECSAALYDMGYSASDESTVRSEDGILDLA